MKATPSQTVGPYLGLGLPWPEGPEADTDGILLHGRVIDGAGDPVPDALVETWQHDPGAFARCPTDEDGRWCVRIPRTPYVAMHVFARGLLRHLTTRVCFDAATVPDEVPADRRGTLLPVPDDRGFRFDIRIQGERETVFFDV